MTAALDTLPGMPAPVPRVVHESDLCTVILGDCRDPDTRPPGQYDLLCTDPPYGVAWESGFRAESFGQLAGDDGSVDWPAVLGEWMQALKKNRHVYVFGYRPDQLDALKLGGTAELIWDKGQPGMGNLSLPWGPEHEPITFGVSASSPAERARARGRLSARLRQGSVLNHRRSGGTAVRHPTEKPIPLMRQLIESSSVTGDLVVDPCAGIGSTLVAAVLSGRRAWGVEVEERYAAIAVERVLRAEALARQALGV